MKQETSPNFDYSLAHDRRAFLKSAALYSGALMIGGSLAPAFGQAPAASNVKWRNQIGLELFTIGNLMRTPEEFEGALAKISEMGYREIEPAGGYNGMQPKEFRAMLDRYKLSMPSTHSGASGTGAALEKTLEGFQIMGMKYTTIGGGGGGAAGGAQIPGLTADEQAQSVALAQAATDARTALNTATYSLPSDPADIRAKLANLSAAELALANFRAGSLAKLQASPNKLNSEQLAALVQQSLPPAPRGGGAGGGANTVDSVKRQAEQHNQQGMIAKKFGMKILIHNHTGEFALLSDGKTTQHDAMASNIDPDLVTMQLDIGWASIAGQDIIGLFKKHPGRYELWHVKDGRGIKGSVPTTDGSRVPGFQGLVPVGEGDVDYKTIFSYAELAGMKHFCIEQDGARGMPDVQTSITNMLAKVLV